MTASKVLSIAAGQIGYSRWDDPEAGTRYGRDYAGRNGAYFGTSGVPFCAMFVTWCNRQAGYNGFGDYAYVPYMIRDARAGTHGLRLVSNADARGGDWACFDWDGDGEADHVGFVEVNHGSYLQTIEGNTSSGTSGSQSNGGGVYRRTRDFSSVCAIIRPPYSTTNNGGFLMALSDNDQRILANRVKEIKDMLTNGKGENLPRRIDGRVRDIKDYVTGGGPAGKDNTLLRQILKNQDEIKTGQAEIKSRLDKLEGK